MRVNSAVALAHHLLANGSHGLVVAGTTGEAATLTDEEQVALVALIVGEVGSEGAVVAGAGGDRAKGLADRAERISVTHGDGGDGHGVAPAAVTGTGALSWRRGRTAAVHVIRRTPSHSHGC